MAVKYNFPFKRLGQCAEMFAVFIIIGVIAAFSQAVVSMGSNISARMIIMLLIYIVMTLIPVMIYRMKKVPFSDFGFKRDRLERQFLIALGIFAVTISCFVILPLLFGMNKGDVLSSKTSRAVTAVFLIIYDLIFVGFGEEIIFRGYFYNGIKNVTNSEIKAVILSSVMFGLWHYPNGHNIMQVIATSIIGLIFGFAGYKIKDCTVLSTSIAHGMHDAFIFILSCLLL